MGSEVRKPGFNSRPQHLVTVEPWAGYLTALFPHLKNGANDGVYYGDTMEAMVEIGEQWLSAQYVFLIIIISHWQFWPLHISQITSLLSIHIGTSFFQTLIDSQLDQNSQVLFHGPLFFILICLQSALPTYSQRNLYNIYIWSCHAVLEILPDAPSWPDLFGLICHHFPTDKAR